MARTTEAKYYLNFNGTLVKEETVFDGGGEAKRVVLSSKDGVKLDGAVEISQEDYKRLSKERAAVSEDLKRASKLERKATAEKAVQNLIKLGLSKEEALVIVYK